MNTSRKCSRRLPRRRRCAADGSAGALGIPAARCGGRQRTDDEPRFHSRAPLLRSREVGQIDHSTARRLRKLLADGRLASRCTDAQPHPALAARRADLDRRHHRRRAVRRQQRQHRDGRAGRARELRDRRRADVPRDAHAGRDGGGEPAGAVVRRSRARGPRRRGPGSSAAGSIGTSGSSSSASRRSPAPRSCRRGYRCPIWQIGLVLMVLLTATNLLSTRSYGEFEFWFASIKVAAIVAFIVVAGSYALGFTSPTGVDARQSRRPRRVCAVRRRGGARRSHGHRVLADGRGDRHRRRRRVVGAVARDRDADDVVDRCASCCSTSARCSAFSPSCRGPRSCRAPRRSRWRSRASAFRSRRRS